MKEKIFNFQNQMEPKNASQEMIEITRDSYIKKENYSLAAEN